MLDTTVAKCQEIYTLTMRHLCHKRKTVSYTSHPPKATGSYMRFVYSRLTLARQNTYINDPPLPFRYFSTNMANYSHEATISGSS